MTGMKALIQRTSVLEDSPRRVLKKASSPVPSPKAVAATPPHFMRTALSSERQYVLSDHLRDQKLQVSLQPGEGLH